MPEAPGLHQTGVSKGTGHVDPIEGRDERPVPKEEETAVSGGSLVQGGGTKDSHSSSSPRRPTAPQVDLHQRKRSRSLPHQRGAIQERHSTGTGANRRKPGAGAKGIRGFIETILLDVLAI